MIGIYDVHNGHYEKNVFSVELDEIAPQAMMVDKGIKSPRNVREFE